MYCPRSPLEELYKSYSFLEDEIKKTKWYEFSLRKKLKDKLFAMKSEAVGRAFVTGISDLEEAGILNPIK